MFWALITSLNLAATLKGGALKPAYPQALEKEGAASPGVVRNHKAR